MIESAQYRAFCIQKNINKDINPVFNAIGNCSLDSGNENAALENIIESVIYKATCKAPLFLFLLKRDRLSDRAVFVIEEFITVTSLSKQSTTVLIEVYFFPVYVRILLHDMQH